MLHTLFQGNIKAKTHFYNEWFAIDLIKAGSSGVAGVVAMCIETGEICYFKAKATVLATGGGGQIYASTTNAYNNTGDGMVITRAGFPYRIWNSGNFIRPVFMVLDA